MSYLVLARKYRPQVFEDVVGQTHVTKTLKGAIAANRVAHAYLFCGPRGVGKTTAARILAKALNCEKGPAPAPCNICDRCREITSGRSLDVLEIDGASNRGIDEIRELRENARFAPSGHFKIYIVDEVHMLTKEAFNALLKTLEEPPSQVVFVLATTDPFKVPPTILSRCQRFDFARIASRDIAAHLADILGREKIEAAPDALAVIARRAQGGLRDALSLTDQVLAAVEGAIDRATVERVLGLVAEEFYFQLTDRIADEDTAGALRLIHEIHAAGADLEEVARGFASHLRDLFLVRVSADLGDLVECAPSEVPRYREQAERFVPDVLGDLLETAATAAVDLRRHAEPRFALELAVAEMARIAGRVPVGEIYRRLVELEQRLGGEAPPARPPAAGGTAPSRRKPAPRSAGARGESAASGGGGDAAFGKSAAGGVDERASLTWSAALDAVKARNISLWGTLTDVAAVGFAPDGALLLRPKKENPLIGEMLGDRVKRALLHDALTGAGMKSPEVRLEGQAAPKNAPRAKKAASKPEPDAEAPPEDTRSMGQVFKDEPGLQKVIDLFDGEVLP